MRLFALTTTLTLFCSPVYSQKPAYLTIISEKSNFVAKDFPHSLALLEYPDGTQKWLGFVSKVKNMPVGEGKIDEGKREGDIDKFVRFEVDAKKLAAAEKIIRANYATKKYAVGVCDCVSFTADLCESTGLKIPARPNFVPGNLVDKLKELNPTAKPVMGGGKGPFPWK